MRYNTIPGTDITVSQIGLGGHAFLADGRVKAMGEDPRSKIPGEIFPGFGGTDRKETLRTAYEAGINFFDFTIDSEKEAGGRNFKELPPPGEFYVQTRPEGLVYNNIPEDTGKLGLLDYDTLKAEAERGCKLLGRERIGFYNFGLFAPAVKKHPGYVARAAQNIEQLKKDGLIKYACVDTLSGREVSLEMIATGVFNGVFSDLSLVSDALPAEIAPAARKQGMAIFTRETFNKANLFKLGEQAGITDRPALARALLKWALAQGIADVVVLGVANADLLRQNLETAENPELTDEDRGLLDTLQDNPEFRAFREKRRAFFNQGMA